MKKEEKLKDISKQKLIQTLLSLESEEAKDAVNKLIEENNYFPFYDSRITNIGLDFIDESFGAPLSQDLCKDVVVELVDQISEKITKSKEGCTLLIHLYLRQPLIIPYAPLLQDYFDNIFPITFSKYAKKWKNRKALIKLLYKSATEKGGMQIIPLLEHHEKYLTAEEFEKFNHKLCNSKKIKVCGENLIDWCDDNLNIDKS